MYKKVAFFYPGSNIGGAQVLFSRIGHYLSENNVELINIDFGDSFISNYLYELNIPFNHIVIEKEGLYKNLIPDDYIFIVSPSYLFILNKFFSFSDSNRFIFWELHPDNIIDHTSFSFFYKAKKSINLKSFLRFIEKKRIKKIKSFLSVANDKNGLYFMCYRNFVTNSSFFDLDIKPCYLPIPQPSYENKCFTSFKFEDEIHIAWLSRLEQDKINILNLLILDLDSYANEHQKQEVFLHIIGIGSSSESILKSNYITIVDIGKLDGNSLTDYMIKNLDLAFAMGTSALEFASRSIPTLLVPSTTLYNDYKDESKRYMWMYQMKGFDVATELYHKNDTLSITDVFSNIEENGIKFYSDASYEYVLANHSMNKVGAALIKILSLVELSYDDIKDSGIYNPSNIELLFLNLKGLVKKILVR